MYHTSARLCYVCERPGHKAKDHSPYDAGVYSLIPDVSAQGGIGGGFLYGGDCGGTQSSNNCPLSDEQIGGQIQGGSFVYGADYSGTQSSHNYPLNGGQMVGQQPVRLVNHVPQPDAPPPPIPQKQ
ncbi:unnamed protein product [Didymodactylos carnosus]|uniref:CCHC-type domain-containing protein n=1 Tax=Didymodactylos carnosus TaxID=1234261 RepID=A0A814YAF2_9BILA|nr:unnamed protein product [Didymodactylos carnosus]CAF3990537.1 unnamed protein product [Didymodactylos carnosus]